MIILPNILPVRSVFFATCILVLTINLSTMHMFDGNIGQDISYLIFWLARFAVSWHYELKFLNHSWIHLKYHSLWWLLQIYPLMGSNWTWYWSSSLWKFLLVGPLNGIQATSLWIYCHTKIIKLRISVIDSLMIIQHIITIYTK